MRPAAMARMAATTLWIVPSAWRRRRVCSRDMAPSGPGLTLDGFDGPAQAGLDGVGQALSAFQRLQDVAVDLVEVPPQGLQERADLLDRHVVQVALSDGEQGGGL